MAITVTKHSQAKLAGEANIELAFGTLALPASWTAAGQTVSISGMERIERLWITGGSAAANGYRYEWDSANQLLKAYRTDQVDDPLEAVPDATDLSALTALEFVAIGQ